VVAVRLRCGCVYFFNLLKTSTVAEHYLTILPQNKGIVWDIFNMILESKEYIYQSYCKSIGLG